MLSGRIDDEFAEPGAGNGWIALRFQSIASGQPCLTSPRSPKSSVSSLDGAWPFGKVPL
jgi:hypothetical protein